MPSSPSQAPTLNKIRQVIGEVLPDHRLCEIRDRGDWVRHIFELVFEGGERAFMKFHTHPGWLDSTANEAHLCSILRQNDLPAPETLFVDSTGEYLEYPFILQSALPGKPISQCLTEVRLDDWPGLFSAVGECYARLHAITGPVSGVWDGSPEKTLPVSPNDFYLENEIINGSGKRALESGWINGKEYQKIVSIWKAGLSEMKLHRPSLVHGSAFPWTICLTQSADGWQVSRLNAMGDFLWWDPAYDLASLQHPPFYAWPAACLDAFWKAYGENPDHRRIQSYALLQHVCALNGTYMPPLLPLSPASLTEDEMAARLRDILAQF